MRLFELIEQAIDLLHLHAGAHRNATLARGFDDFGLGTLLRGHGVDDAFDAAHGFILHPALHLRGSLSELGREFVEH